MLEPMTGLKRILILIIILLVSFQMASCGQVALAPTARAEKTRTLTLSLIPTSTLVPITEFSTPLPTQLTVPVTPNPTQAKQQDEIKDVIQAYFDLRYQVLSVSPPDDFQVNGFGDLVSDSPDARDFLVTEMAKLAVERKWVELNKFRYAKYEYSLKYKDIAIDASAQVATISLLEDFTVITERAIERNPKDPNITRGDQAHEMVLYNEQGQWKIISDIYLDAWWRSYRKPGMSTDEILSKINAETRILKTSPSLDLSNASTDTEFSCPNFSADASSHPYDRNAAVTYASNHAGDGTYNPDYPSYDEDAQVLGGDCTNFVSQAIYEGGNASMFIPNPLPGPSKDGQPSVSIIVRQLSPII